MSVKVTTHYIPPQAQSSSALVFQITSMLDSYMIWSGISQGTAEEVEVAASNGKLAHDWACAMPPSKLSMPGPATSLFRTASADVALAMAQRLARRFKKQIYLSVDLPPAFMTMGEGMKVALEMEKHAVQILKGLEDSRL